MVDERSGCIREALTALGIERLVISIHDASFPSHDGDDIGRGSPYALGGVEFLEFAHALGFDGVLLGPQGITSEHNASPYDGTLFSRNALSLDLATLVDQRLLSRETLDAFVARRPGTRDRVPNAFVWRSLRRVLGEAVSHVDRYQEPLSQFQRANADWLERDALFEALSLEHGTSDTRAWAETPEGALDARLFEARDDLRARRIESIRARHAESMAAFCFAQFLVHEQHSAWRKTLARWPMKIYGDLQIGLSPADAWTDASLIRRDYVMGAPPSRTTPAGQPWGYAVLDPEQFRLRDGNDGPVLRFFRARIEKLLGEFDGLRVDHPHGLVCPWVYRTDDPDPAGAVLQGARMFESPALSDHPALSRFARVRDDQIDHGKVRWDDHRVQRLEPAQIDEYAVFFDALMTEMQRHGRARTDVLCEVLSTCPQPLASVMARHALGRFRVTQKSRLDDIHDVYRGENASPADWIMVGTHDSEPLVNVVEQWRREGVIEQRAAYLAQRLAGSSSRETFAKRLASDPHELTQAMFADLFVGPARNVMVFFADLFGIHEVYNVPGTVNDVNWTLRVPHDWRETYFARAARNEALNIPRALAMALRARGTEHRDLADRLDRVATTTR